LVGNARKFKQKLEKLSARSVGRGPSEEDKVVVKKLRRALH
jgi:hypothetical protein